ncbi:MAG: hypothetical protein KBE04_00435 [Phycisphaerae bacterium]|nr:hypothetical protein [Phycisphaerae bacterium]
MRWRDLSVWIVCGVLAAGLLWTAGSQLDSINAHRKAMKLVINDPVENAPPSLAWATVAMGAFRGLVVDILWMRADALKEQGQFFDARQMAEWITRLQPRFAAVWEFQAWNMAYNISVAIPATQPDQRWRWVKNGYELLRDQGIPLNPKSLALYRELGRIFQHKMGGITDEAQKYYKIQFAREIGPVVEGADQGFFEALAKAPTDWPQIASDPNVQPLIEALRGADPAFAEPEQFAGRYLALVQDPNRYGPAARRVLESFEGTPAIRQFGIMAKAHQVRHVWKMDPAFMVELNRQYGPVDFNDPNHVIPLDWRHPDTHAIYWAAKGLQIAAQDEGRSLETVELNTDRIIIHSLQNLFRYGRLLFFNVMVSDPNTEGGPAEAPTLVTDVFLRPDLRMFDRYHRALLALLDKYDTSGSREESLGTGHRNMLKNAILSFYQAGLVAQAERIYREMRSLYPLPEFNLPLSEFCRLRFVEELDGLGIHDATEQVLSLLKESYYYYAIGSDDEAFGSETLARQVYDYYQKENLGDTRLALPDFARMRYTALVDLLQDPQYPPYLQENLKARIQEERPKLFEQLMQVDQQMRDTPQQNQPAGPGAVP